MSLQQLVFPKLIRKHRPEEAIRFWVAGCATGEEVYSLTIALVESLGDMISNTPIKILATDISEAALEKARRGSYVDNIALDVSAARLRRFFSKNNGSYQISQSIRDLCVFSRHNVSHDTPFANLDLISCRNLLIYLDLSLQKRVIPYFHYALRPGGHLVLGPAETTGAQADLFELVDKDARIYSKKPGNRQAITFPLSEPGQSVHYPPLPTGALSSTVHLDVNEVIAQLLLQRFGPAGLLVNEELQVVTVRGNLAPYLRTRTSTVGVTLREVLHADLLDEVLDAIQQARREQRTVHRHDLWRSDVDQAGKLALEVIPLQLSEYPAACLVLFERLAQRGVAPRSASSDNVNESGYAQLADELEHTRTYLQSVIEHNEVTNEELRAANEEILSSNEELQSTNEELQTAKEEMQSTNEELTTVNDELKHRNSELGNVNDDLINLLGGLKIPIVMVNRELKIRRFTPSAEGLFSLIPSDVGRPLCHLRHNLNITNLPEVIRGVIDSLTFADVEVQDQQGHWYSLRIRPYVTSDNRIEGATLALVGIDALKQAAEQLTAARDNADAIVDTVWEPLLVLDGDLRIQRTNAAFCQLFQISSEKVSGLHLAELPYGALDQAQLVATLRRIIPENDRLRDFELEVDLSAHDRRTLLLNAHRIYWEGSATQMILVALEDVTSRRRELAQAKLLAEEQARRAEAEAANRSKDEFLAMLAHELRNPLAPIRNTMYILRKRVAGDELVDHALDISERQLAHMARLLDDLLDVARIARGKVELRTDVVEVQAALRQAIEGCQSLIRSRDVDLQVTLPDSPMYIEADPARLEQILGNLLNNAAKYTDVNGAIQVTGEARQAFVEIRIRDTGVGIAPELLPNIFDLFTQADRSLDRSQGGLGIGLTLVKRLVTLHGGTVEALSEGIDRGATFVVRFPRLSRTNVLATNSAADEGTAATLRRVLVVEDNVDGAAALAMLLRHLGHQVSVAHDGTAALEMAAAESPEVVLLDIGLPGISGYDVAKRLRNEIGLQDALIVAVTGYGQDHDRVRADESGIDRHLVKPVNPRELVALLATLRRH
ncbi:MAG: CheR family methyltransferase [Planctomycetia bacterium]|nr:CheR family methyltransferase [Planctomycetia bacterium]